MKSTALSAGVLTAIYADATITDLGGVTLDGTNVYFNLHTAWPGRGGNQTTNEAAYAGYDRVAVARGTSEFSVSGNDVVTDNRTEFPERTSTGAAEVLMFWSVGVASSSTGAILHMGAIGGETPKAFVADTDDDITSPAHGLSDNDRVVLWSVPDGITFPTGPTEGTVYHVISSATDTFQVSTTQGGGAVDITAAGGGKWQQVKPISVENEGDTPMLKAGLSISEM